MRFPTLPTILAVWIALTAAPRAAGAGLLGWSLGPRAGWSRTTDSDVDAATFGAAARFHVLNPLTAEIAVDLRREDIEAGSIETVPVQLSALVSLLPFMHATGGIGWYRVQPSLDGIAGTVGSFDTASWDTGYHLGAGAHIPLNERVAVTGEVRYIFLAAELDELRDLSTDLKADFTNLLVGLQFAVF